MYYLPGEIPSAFSFNIALEGGRSQSDIDNGDPSNHTISIDLVPGVSKWNSRAVEFSIDSLTYSRIVASVGEVQARNCLIPVPEESSGSLGSSPVYVPNTLSIDKTAEGVPLKLASHPRVPNIYANEVSDNFVFLCGDKDGTKEKYFTGYVGKWDNGFVYDQFSKGRIVYVHSGPVGYLVTPTQTENSFPCIVETPPYCFSWSYNNTTVHTQSDESQTQFYQYRFDNRLELLINLARHLIKKHLGITPYITYDYVKGEPIAVVATVSDFENGTSFLNTQESLAQIVSSASTKDSAAGRWLDTVQQNAGPSSSADTVASIFHSLQAIKRWVCFSHTESGVLNPTNRYVDQNGEGTIVSDEDILYLGDIVNNTSELKKATALTMVVTPLVPGRNYTTFSNPVVEKLSQTTKKVANLDSKLLWNGDCLAPFSKEASYFRSQTKDLVEQYNSKSLKLQSEMDNINKEMSVYEGKDVALCKEVDVTVPEEPSPTFIPVAQHGEVGLRKLATVLTPEYIAESLDTALIVSPLSGRKKIDSLPTDLYNCYLSPVLVVDRSVDQHDWLMLLYCFSFEGIISQSIDASGKQRVYELFDGHDYVPAENVQPLCLFIDQLNATSAKSLYLPSGFENGFSHEKNGGFWRAVYKSEVEGTEVVKQDDDSASEYEYYPYWYDIIKNKFVTPWKESSAYHQVNIVYACDIENDSYQGDNFALYKVEEKKNENGDVIGYIITEGAAPSRTDAYSIKAQLMAFSDLLGVLSGIPENLQDTTVEKIDTETGSITRAKHVPAKYSQATTNTTDQVTSVPASGTRFTEFVYQPPQSAGTSVTQKKPDLATVKLPITSLLIPQLDIPPRFDSLFCSATKPSLTAYSYFVSKSLGLVELPDSKPTYQEAFYSFEDFVRPFCRTVSLPQNKEEELHEELIAELSQEGWSNIKVITYKTLNTATSESGETNQDDSEGSIGSSFWSWVWGILERGMGGGAMPYLYAESGEHGSEENAGSESDVGDSQGTDDDDGDSASNKESGTLVTYICFGTYEPVDPAKPEKIYFDLASKSMPLYVQSTDAVSTQESYARYVPLRAHQLSSSEEGTEDDPRNNNSGYSFWDWISLVIHMYTTIQQNTMLFADSDTGSGSNNNGDDNADTNDDGDNNNSSDTSETSEHTDEDTCGWIRYRYFDELKTNQTVEKVTLPVPAILGSDIVVDNNRWVVNGNVFDPVMFTPFWSGYSLSYGYVETESIDPVTLEATIAFSPYFTKTDSTSEQDTSENSDNDDSGGFWSWVWGILERSMGGGAMPYLYAESGENDGKENEDAGDTTDPTSTTDTADTTCTTDTVDDKEGDGETDPSQATPPKISLSNSAPSYNQYFSFPYMTSGYSPFARTRLTTKTYKALRSDWVPAICKTLDHNEVLVPGMVVEFEEAETTINDQTFRYLIVTPPESYSTVLEGTPEQVIYKVTYRAPSPSDLEAGTIKEDDCWITGIKRLDDDESPQMNPPSGTIYRFGVKQNSETGAPKITEPFGAFNNCDNKGSLTVFLRTTAWGVNYTCTARLDHIPFGYAVPSKTPSCYYKSGNDDCAAHMVGQRYLVKRIEADNRLYLTGACYVPCSTLSSFN